MKNLINYLMVGVILLAFALGYGALHTDWFDNTEGILYLVGYVAIFGIVLYFYFLPFVVANHRKAKHRYGILVLNIFAITVIPWVAALIWAFCDNSEK